MELLAVREPRKRVGPINLVLKQFSAYFISNGIMIIPFCPIAKRGDGVKTNIFTIHSSTAFEMVVFPFYDLHSLKRMPMVWKNYVLIASPIPIWVLVFPAPKEN